ncbi:MAG: hypothetical protein WKF30_17815 [Pyrinomonadaceae bacterium]
MQSTLLQSLMDVRRRVAILASWSSAHKFIGLPMSPAALSN